MLNALFTSYLCIQQTDLYRSHVCKYAFTFIWFDGKIEFALIIFAPSHAKSKRLFNSKCTLMLLRTVNQIKTNAAFHLPYFFSHGLEITWGKKSENDYHEDRRSTHLYDHHYRWQILKEAKKLASDIFNFSAWTF